MRLVTFGCSYTAGIGLKDVHPRITISSLSWPNKLSSLIGCDLYNNGHTGASNKEITWHIQNFDFEEDDFVIIQWTFFHRSCYFVQQSDHIEIEQMHRWKKDKFIQNYFKYLSHTEDFPIDTYTRMDYVNRFLKDKNIKTFNFLARRDDRRQYKWHDVEILDTAIQDYQGGKYPLASDRQHPGEKAHEAIANSLYNEIKESL